MFHVLNICNCATVTECVMKTSTLVCRCTHADLCYVAPDAGDISVVLVMLSSCITGRRSGSVWSVAAASRVYTAGRLCCLSVTAQVCLHTASSTCHRVSAVWQHAATSVYTSTTTSCDITSPSASSCSAGVNYGRWCLQQLFQFSLLVVHHILSHSLMKACYVLS